MKNGLKLIGLFLVMLGVVVGVIVAVTVGLSAFAGYLATSTPDQAVALGTYVQTSRITPEQAQSALALAQADATVRHEQTDRFRAQTERMTAEDARVKTIKDALGLSKLGDMFWVFGVICALGLIAVILLRRKAQP